MERWVKYVLVPIPGDADLVFEIRFVAKTGPVRVMNGAGGSPAQPQLRLAILDPKTHVVLWAFTVPVEGANREATARKNYDQAMANLVDDVKKLTAPPATTPDAPANK
jgi:hypothetical protein